jgi:hypothetical protein
MAATERLTPKRDWSEPFFASYRQSGNVRLACEAAGVTRQAAYARRDTDEEFAGRWAEAAESAVERLEDIAWKRAEAGSDVLVMFLLKGLRPEKYRDNPKVYVNAGRMSDAEIISGAKSVLIGIDPAGAGTPGNGRE